MTVQQADKSGAGFAKLARGDSLQIVGHSETDPLSIFQTDHYHHATGELALGPHVDRVILALVADSRSRVSWVLWLVGVIAMGILSRVLHTGLVVFDKYLGDALYAMMVYATLRLLSRTASAAAGAIAVMTVIELFQLTMIPAHMLASDHLITRMCARLIGTQFSFLDLLAYGVGIGCIYLADGLYPRDRVPSHDGDRLARRFARDIKGPS